MIFDRNLVRKNGRKNHYAVLHNTTLHYFLYKPQIKIMFCERTEVVFREFSVFPFPPSGRDNTENR